VRVWILAPLWAGLAYLKAPRVFASYLIAGAVLILPRVAQLTKAGPRLLRDSDIYDHFVYLTPLLLTICVASVLAAIFAQSHGSRLRLALLLSLFGAALNWHYRAMLPFPDPTEPYREVFENSPELALLGTASVGKSAVLASVGVAPWVAEAYRVPTLDAQSIAIPTTTAATIRKSYSGADVDGGQYRSVLPSDPRRIRLDILREAGVQYILSSTLVPQIDCSYLRPTTGHWPRLGVPSGDLWLCHL
jgi:hypothetical protein